LLNPDFREMLSALSAEDVEFMVVGAYAMAAHGFPRATGDLDIWFRPGEENAQRVWRALDRFGAPRSRITAADFQTPDVVFQIGLPPRRIDLITSIDAVTFEEAWCDRKQIEVECQPLSVISFEHLLRNKRACGRPKDLADAAWLEQGRET
jgi:hypothetical protein